MKKNKLGIIVPYRNRENHLKTFSTYMKSYLKDFSYEIIVINQSDLASATAALLTVGNVAFVEPVVAGQKIPGQPTPPIKVVDGKILLNATLKVAPDSVEARNTIPIIREAVHKVDKDILGGGGTAVQYDTDVASRHDNRLIIPVVLLIIGVILGLSIVPVT